MKGEKAVTQPAQVLLRSPTAARQLKGHMHFRKFAVDADSKQDVSHKLQAIIIAHEKSRKYRCTGI